MAADHQRQKRFDEVETIEPTSLKHVPEGWNQAIYCVRGGRGESTMQEGRRTLTGQRRSGEITLKHPHRRPWEGGEASVLFSSVSILTHGRIRISIFSSIPKPEREESSRAFLCWGGGLTGSPLFRFIHCFISAFFGRRTKWINSAAVTHVGAVF